ncbi:hypothetical protein CALCODRAFT_513598 [Calocera cornea HHB12733]|uniref:Uncharacterized protein n=1 Tax=Calocera cornea HHB12733 TaxID=1353952 RepID=A0A166MPL1_9BASI|nr:hypothetical protein CALCODRAFT_513598 [Calocera cornea HHB12733]
MERASHLAQNVKSALPVRKRERESERLQAQELAAQQRFEQEQEQGRPVELPAAQMESKIDDTNYKYEDHELKESKLLKYFNEPAGEEFCAPFVCEVLDAKCLPRSLQDFLTDRLDTLRLACRNLDSRPDDDKSKQLRMDDMIAYLRDSGDLASLNNAANKITFTQSLLQAQRLRTGNGSFLRGVDTQFEHILALPTILCSHPKRYGLFHASLGRLLKRSPGSIAQRTDSQLLSNHPGPSFIFALPALL